MTEKNLNFDTYIDRKNTDCLKYDFAVKRGKPVDILPLWVADMDFQTSSIVLDKLKERVEHGIFGYSEAGEEYFDALSGWMRERHDWEVKEEWIVKTPGIVPALALAVKAFTEIGGAVLLQQPVYYPFREIIEDNQRYVVSNDLVLEADGSYRIDFVDFEEKIVKYGVKLFLLCSPHNPVGRVWTKEELRQMGEICRKHQVIVVSDEIHEDFVFGEHEHCVFTNADKAFEEFSIVCTSPAKTFNLAGLQISNIFIANEALRKKFSKERDGIGYSQVNTLGLTACETAYRYGGVWYDKMIAYIKGNIAFLQEYLKRELPQIRLTREEGTYLAWLDFRNLGLSEEALEELIVQKAGLWLDSGAVFGKTGEGFERINLACRRATLQEALDRLSSAIRGKGYGK